MHPDITVAYAQASDAWSVLWGLTIGAAVLAPVFTTSAVANRERVRAGGRHGRTVATGVVLAVLGLSVVVPAVVSAFRMPQGWDPDQDAKPVIAASYEVAPIGKVSWPSYAGQGESSEAVVLDPRTGGFRSCSWTVVSVTDRSTFLVTMLDARFALLCNGVEPDRRTS